MTQLACPLCGKNTSLNSYDPSQFDLDIYEVEMMGLGRGKGFRVVGKHSLLGEPETLAPLRERLLDLVELLHRRNIIDDAELQERFGFLSPQVQEDSELESVAEKAVQDIYDAMVEDETDENEEIAVRLRSAVNKLISDYNHILSPSSTD